MGAGLPVVTQTLLFELSTEMYKEIQYRETLKSRRVLGGVLDYKRTAKWLRELLKYPEAYTTKLTELPESRRQSRMFSTEVRRPSEPTLPTNGLARGISRRLHQLIQIRTSL